MDLKATGMTRPVDELGRVVLPKELRKSLGIVESEDRVEIFVDGHDIVLRKLVRGCTFCKGTIDLKEFGGHEICGHCRDDIRKGLE
jgi:transcriptional pleiotropic regulator of transition state genes